VRHVRRITENKLSMIILKTYRERKVDDGDTRCDNRENTDDTEWK
jgi:hypothetical protein